MKRWRSGWHSAAGQMMWLLICWVVGNVAAGEAPERIVSLAPNITEIVFKLGQGNRLVGRTEYCLFPPAARSIPSVGAYLNPDYEKLVSLRPELIVMLPNPGLQQKLQALGFRVAVLPDETVEDILKSILQVGKLLSVEERALQVVKGIQDTLEAVRKKNWPGPPPRAVLLVGREAGSLRGLYAAGGDTYLSRVWEICGGRNAFEEVPHRYFDVSREALVQRNPDLILEFRVLEPGNREQEIQKLKKDWLTLENLKAVETDKVYILGERYFLIPGPRITRIAVAFSAVLRHYFGMSP